MKIHPLRIAVAACSHCATVNVLASLAAVPGSQAVVAQRPSPRAVAPAWPVAPGARALLCERPGTGLAVGILSRGLVGHWPSKRIVSCVTGVAGLGRERDMAGGRSC